jgi:glycosyltransferase involved in cell wall biosynthesis
VSTEPNSPRFLSAPEKTRFSSADGSNPPGLDDGVPTHCDSSPEQEDSFVSILINNYNYGQFLGEAIRSALSQSYLNREIIVVDDGSTDDSLQIAQSFGDEVRLIAKQNGGQASAFNAGFAASRGGIICLLDADDVWLPGKVERIVEVFRQNPDIDWCFENLKLFRDSQSERCSRDRCFVAGKVDARKSMLDGVFPENIESASSGLSFRRELLARILPMPHARSILLCDDYIKTACYALSPGIALDEELSLQRIHGANLYTNTSIRDRRVTGQMNLLMGIHLQRRFKECVNPGAKMLCRGCAILTVFGGWQPGDRRELWKNLRMMGPKLALHSVARTMILVVLEALRLNRR